MYQMRAGNEHLDKMLDVLHEEELDESIRYYVD